MKQSNGSGMFQQSQAGRRGRPPSPGGSRRSLAGSAAVALALLAACGGPIPKTNYYVLDLPTPTVRSADPLPRTAVIMPFRASEMLTQDRIVYRPNRGEVGFYEYHRWAEDPRTTVASALLERLRQRNTFRQIVLFDGRTKADYEIRGRLERLEEVDSSDGVSVRVRVSAKLVDASTSETLWQGSAEDSGTVAVPEVRDVVAKMSEAAESSLEELAAQLDRHLRSTGPRPGGATGPLPRDQRN